MRRVTCVTVTYGETPALTPMIESLVRTVRHDDVDVVVVAQPDDEGSMASVVRHSFSSVTLIDSAENLGFGGANNLAVDGVSSDFVAFLNPDLILTEGWLDPLVTALDDRSVGIVAPPLLTPVGFVDEAGQIMYSDGGSEPQGGSGFPARYGQLMFSRDVDYSSAACWLMRRSDFVEVGGFSSAYHPAYFEDVDLAFRIWKSGRRCRLVANRPVVHAHDEPSPGRVEIAQRSREVFRRTWSDELTRQPDRDPDRTRFDRVRDHRCVDSRVERVTTSMSFTEADALMADIGAWAEQHPTSRATVLCEPRPEIEGWRRQWCARGLEIDSFPS